MSKFQKVASQVAKLEGKKVQTSIGNVREILARLVDAEAVANLAGRKGPISALIEFAFARRVSIIRKHVRMLPKKKRARRTTKKAVRK